jgi:hypothetical protein
MGHCLFRTNKQKIPIRRSVERLGVFNCVFLETGLDMEEVRTVKKVMERLQDMYSIQDTLIETVACLLMLCAGIVIGSFFKSLLF